MPVRATKGNMFTTNVGSIFEMGGSDFSYRGIEDAFRQMQNQIKTFKKPSKKKIKELKRKLLLRKGLMNRQLKKLKKSKEWFKEWSRLRIK